MEGGQLTPKSETFVFGGYELLGRVAAGGMAEIFLAREVDGDRSELLVVKRLLGHVAQHGDLVQMFLDEARVASTLEHPNIVKIFNVGGVGEHYFLSMEYLCGVDLTVICRRLWRKQQTLPLNLALYIVASVAQGLAYAHAKRGTDGRPLQIVHRDVSPHNIFVTFDGQVKLLDFGVAKAANALHHTRTGALVGKVTYMSPEQTKGELVDRRSDLFSLGTVMWELFAGRRLHRPSKLGEFEILRRICERPAPRPSQIREEIPRVIDELVMRALEKDRSRRYQRTEELVDAIQAAAKSLELELSPYAMAAFFKREFADRIREIDTRLQTLREADPSDSSLDSAVPVEPTPSIPSVAPPTPSQPSPPAGSIEAFEPLPVEGGDPDTDRTERLPRRGRASVRWKSKPTPLASPQPTGKPPIAPFLRQRWSLLLAGAAILVLTSALFLWLS